MSVTTTYAQNLRALCSEENQHMWRVDHHKTTPPHQRQPTKLQLKLLSVAASVRERIGPLVPPSAQELSFTSNFTQPDENLRGFCNWAIPGHLMIGQYPGQNPLKDGPSEHATAQHLERVTHQANVSVFCSLQRETPAQDVDEEWTQEGHCYLQPESIRRQLPLPFVQYAPLVRKYSNHEPLFLHAPIEDLAVPECQEPLQELLLELLEQMNQGKTLYIHCWGGRGRAGLVGACLLALIWPNLKAQTILNWIQRGYATRAGHERLAPEYASSPQTCPQREYVRAFVEEYQALYQYQQEQTKK